MLGCAGSSRFSYVGRFCLSNEALRALYGKGTWKACRYAHPSPVFRIEERLEVLGCCECAVLTNQIDIGRQERHGVFGKDAPLHP